MQPQEGLPTPPSAELRLRTFKINSSFGESRTWRSRKARPCDTCRKRKTACVIPTEPPCNFCKQRGLVCEASSVTAHDRASSAREFSRTQVKRTKKHPERQNNVTDTQTIPATGSTAACWRLHPIEQQQPFHASTASQSPLPRAPCRHHSLEDNVGRTAHCMGPASEQDNHLMNTFRSAIINDHDEVDANIIQIYCGEHPISQPPIHFLLLENEFPHHTNRALQLASDAIEDLVHPFGPGLVRLYFKHVHPVYPILAKARFLRQYHDAKKTIPASLRGAVYALACTFWNDSPALTGSCPFEQHVIINHAYDSLRRELEAPNLSKLQASLLLLHSQPPEVDSVETPSTWTSTAQATACAQMIGLHRDPSTWNIEPWEKSLRKKLWWAVFATDAWSSICHGNPLHIHESSFDTAILNLDDLRADEDVADDLLHLVDSEDTHFQSTIAARYLEMIHISRLLHQIIACSFQIKPFPDGSNTPISTQAALSDLHKRLEDWQNLLPRCLLPDTRLLLRAHDNSFLQLCYYSTQVLLFRALMHPATAAARSDLNSNLRRWLATSLTGTRSFMSYIAAMDETSLDGFLPRHARSQLILCGNFLIYLFLLAKEPEDIKQAYELLESFQASLQRIECRGSSRVKLLLKPVNFRINSFFSQAEAIMRRKYTSAIEQ